MNVYDICLIYIYICMNIYIYLYIYLSFSPTAVSLSCLYIHNIRTTDMDQVSNSSTVIWASGRSPHQKNEWRAWPKPSASRPVSNLDMESQ
jgi:hypothetical protein